MSQCDHVDDEAGACTLAAHRHGQHVYFGRTVELMPSKVVVDTDRVTRLVVVTPEGRVLDDWGVELQLFIQDSGQTLKVFTQQRTD